MKNKQMHQPKTPVICCDILVKGELLESSDEFLNDVGRNNTSEVR